MSGLTDINRVILRGRIEGELVLRQTTNSQVLNFVVATQGERQKFPLRHKCAAWGSLAHTISELSDGAGIHVEGRLQTRSYEARDTGEKKWITEVVVEKLLDGEQTATEGEQGSMPF